MRGLLLTLLRRALRGELVGLRGPSCYHRHESRHTRIGVWTRRLPSLFFFFLLIHEIHTVFPLPLAPSHLYILIFSRFVPLISLSTHIHCLLCTYLFSHSSGFHRDFGKGIDVWRWRELYPASRGRHSVYTAIWGGEAAGKLLFFVHSANTGLSTHACITMMV